MQISEFDKNGILGKGFSSTNIKQMRGFYQTYSKGQTASDEFNLSWSHYLKLMRIEDENERKFYEIEAFKNNWSLIELQRQYDSALRCYQRSLHFGIHWITRKINLFRK